MIACMILGTNLLLSNHFKYHQRDLEENNWYVTLTCSCSSRACFCLFRMLLFAKYIAKIHNKEIKLKVRNEPQKSQRCFKHYQDTRNTRVLFCTFSGLNNFSQGSGVKCNKGLGNNATWRQMDNDSIMSSVSLIIYKMGRLIISFISFVKLSEIWTSDSCNHLLYHHEPSYSTWLFQAE